MLGLETLAIVYGFTVLLRTLSPLSLVAKTLEAFGTVDILINNAGILYQKPISETTDEEWNDEIPKIKNNVINKKRIYNK